MKKREVIEISPMSTTEGNPLFNKLYRQKDGSDYVSIRLTSQGFQFSASGIANLVTKSAIQRFRKDALPAFLKFAGVNVNPDSNTLTESKPTSLTGVLQVQESFTPWYEGQPHKINPSTNEDILVDGKRVYRNTVFLADENAPTYVFGSVEDGVFTAGLVEEEEVVVETKPATPAQAFAETPTA